ncbi:MAG: hypothetical protein IJE51_01995 [Clostridia bacterium]|nr:hypothetical protein [Clostridia bacterium]
MTNYILLLISILVEVGKAVTYNIFSKDKKGNPSDLHMMNFATMLVAGIGLLPFADFSVFPSVFTILLGVLFGILTISGAFCNMKALSLGPVSYTQLIGCSSMIVPAFSGAIFWQEDLSIGHIIAVVLLLGCFFFSSDSKGDNKSANMKWLLFALLLFAFTGSIGITQKVQQTSAYAAEASWFLIIALITASIISLFIWLTQTKGEYKSERKALLDPKLIGMFLFIGFVIAFTNKVNLYLSGVMPSIIFFPLVNGGALLLTVLAGFVIFKEKLSKKQSLGMALGAAAVLLLCFA